MKTERYGRNTLTIIDEEEGGSRVYGSLGSDDADSIDRFGRGRMFFAAQWMSLFTYNFLLKKISEVHPRSVLHLGCGIDNLRRVLEQNYVMVEEYTGIDLHLSNLRAALRATNPIAADYQCRDLSRGLRDMSDSSVDVVVAIELVEHMPTKEEGVFLFKEILRVAKRTAIVATPQVLGSEMRFSDFHRYEFTRAELLALSAEAIEKFPVQSQYGINIGTKEYKEILENEAQWFQHADAYMTPKILRGVYAAGNPEKANDLLMCFEK